MADDLNKQYFDTKKTHSENYSRKGYVIWILIGIGALSFFIATRLIEKKKLETAKSEAINAFLDTGIVSKSDTLIGSKSTGTSILILKDCLYKEFESSLAVVSNDDTSGLIYVTKRLIPSPDFTSSVKQWSIQISSVNSSYKFTNIKRDSIGGLFYETADMEFQGAGGIPMKGTVKIIKKGGMFYLLDVSAYVGTWDQLSDQIRRVQDSFEIVE